LVKETDDDPKFQNDLKLELKRVLSKAEGIK
jgi:hypothetical protein